MASVKIHVTNLHKVNQKSWILPLTVTKFLPYLLQRHFFDCTMSVIVFYKPIPVETLYSPCKAVW